MPKNSSISTRTSASLMPTSSVQIARTNFIVSASIDQSPLLAEECAGGQTFSTDARAGRGPFMHDRRPPGAAPGRWGEELSATLSLAWPLILANLTQQIIQATDVLL